MIIQSFHHHENLLLHFTLTELEKRYSWEYIDELDCSDVQILKIYANENFLKDALNVHELKLYEQYENRFALVKKSLFNCKVDLTDHSVFDFFPIHFFKDLLLQRSDLIRSLIDRLKKPKNYSLIKRSYKFYSKVNRNQLNISKELCEYVKGKTKLKYTPLGSVNGRVKLLPNSFPILSLRKDKRVHIFPNNDYLFELDYNGLDIRVLLGLSSHSNPDYDIHMWNRQHVFQNSISRDEAKRMFFAWLYNSTDPQLTQYLSKLNRFYNKEQLLRKHWNNGKIENDYGRIMHSTEHLAVNRLISSTSADLCTEKFLEIDEFLSDKESYIYFTMADSIVIDLSKREKDLVIPLTRMMEKTRYGKFLVNTKLGKNYGDMKTCTF